MPPGPPPPPPPPPSGGAPAITSMVDAPELIRDRVLILGRRKAGKTVFLARLYEQAWRGCEGVHMRAADGPLHALCMDMVAQLKDGTWPAATVGSLAGGVEVSWRDKKATMVMLDYPGEVFRRAFVDGATDEQSLDLLDHVDRAAAVIVLIDPGNVHAGDFDEVVDDDYGMVAAIDRIRKSADGQSIPIAVALTKCDVHIGLIRAAGGARGFVQKHLPNLLRYGGSMRMFATAAVKTRRDAAGRPVPSTRHDPAGLIDTMVYCMRHVGRRMDVDVRKRAEAARAEQGRQIARAEAAESRRTRRKWVAFWVSAAVLAIVAVGVSFWANSAGDNGSSPPEADSVLVDDPFDGGSAEDSGLSPDPGQPQTLLEDRPQAAQADAHSGRKGRQQAVEEEPLSDRPDAAAPSSGRLLSGGFAEVFKRGHRSTPFIETQCQFGMCPLPGAGHATSGYHGHGSGVLIDHDGDLFIVTNRHVIAVDDAFQLAVRFVELGDGGAVAESLSPIEANARDFWVHPDGVDLAWLNVSHHRAQFQNAAISPMRLSEHPLSPGSDIAFVGHPGRGDVDGFEPLNLTKGVVSRVFDDPEFGWTIGTDATLNPGNSGGPAFNENGRVSGIAVGTRGASFGMDGGSQNFAVDAREIPVAIARGVPFDPATMIASGDPGTLSDRCGTLESWPLADDELDLLKAIASENWQLAGCELVTIQAGGKLRVDVGRSLRKKTHRSVLVVVSPHNAVDADLGVYAASGRLLGSDIRPDNVAVVQCELPGDAGRGIHAEVMNSSGSQSDFLVLVFE